MREHQTTSGFSVHLHIDDHDVRDDYDEDDFTDSYSESSSSESSGDSIDDGPITGTPTQYTPYN